MTFTVSKTVSDETLDCIIQIESGGKLTAKAPTSSALGLGQFLNATWLGVVKKHRPDLLDGRTQPEVLALRTSPQLAVELLARFTEDNQRAIGMNCSGGDLYLAHFLGVGDAKGLFRSDPNTPVSQLVTIDVINANRSIMLGKTAGQVRAWAAKRMHESGGHGWVAKYYTPAAPEPAPVPDEPSPPAADPEPTAEDIPDPQDAPPSPLPPERPDPVPPVEPAPPVSEPSWLKRKWKAVTRTIGSFLGIGGAAIFDWRIVAVLMGAIFVGAILIVIFMGPADVRGWVRKQVS